MKIKPFFDEIFKDVKFDKKLVRRIKMYRVNFSTQTPDHVSFFGGTLLGTNIVRFKSNYVREFFMDIINIEPQDVAERLHEVPAINTKFKISGDVFNLCLFYMAHRFLNEKGIDEEGMKECILIFNYRTISALISKRFRFLANMEIAIAVHESLSNKFILKQKGSWVHYLDYRATKHMAKNAPYRSNMKTLKDDKHFINTINEGNSAIRSTFNILYNRFIEIRESGSFVRAGSIIDTMDDTSVGDISDKLINTIRNVQDEVMRENQFYDEELLSVLQSVIPDHTAANIADYIRGFSALANDNKHQKAVGSLISDTITLTYDRINKEPMTDRERANSSQLVRVVKSALYATRIVDPLLLDIKERAEVLVHAIKSIKSSQRVAAIKHALLLYIFMYSLLIK